MELLAIIFCDKYFAIETCLVSASESQSAVMLVNSRGDWPSQAFLRITVLHHQRYNKKRNKADLHPTS